MGYVISDEQYQRQEANARAGRTCQGGRCAQRATKAVEMLGWDHQVGQGAPHRSLMVMCGKHARQAWQEWAGCGVNIVTLDIHPISTKATRDDIAAWKAEVVARPITNDDVRAAVARWAASGVPEQMSRKA